MYRHCALALVLVLAGCSGLVGDPTATPEPEPGDGASDRDGTGEAPTVPGVAADGSVKESALLNAHFETLDGNASRQDYLTRSNGTVESNATTVRNETHLLDRSRGSFPSTTYQSTDRTWSVEHERWGEERYTFTYDRTGITSSAGSIDFGVAVYVGSGQFERAGTTTYRGERVVRLEADDAKPSGLAGAYERYDVTLLVDERGLIRRATGTVSAGDEPSTSFDISATTDVERVPRPSWAESVLRGRTAMTADDTAVELRITGGPTLPANTTVEFSIELREHTVRTDRPIEPGDTLYLSLKPGEYESTATLTRTPPDPDARLSIGDEVSQATIRLEDPPGLDAPMEVFFRAGPDPLESVGEDGETEPAD